MDRGPGTSFELLTFGNLQLATVDIATGQVTVHQGFAEGKHINPQFSADGRSLFFVSDQDGISDLYRMDLTGGQLYRITRLATGVSGVTGTSPAITVAQGTGRLMFTIFRGQGHEIVALEPSELIGTPVSATAGNRVASAATLPPGDVAGNMTVAAYLSDPNTGLVSGSEFRVVPYRASFALDALGQPSIGVTAGGYFGTGVVGGISALWGDQLGDQQIFSAIQANGTVKDFGGAVYYQNLKRRLNWLAGAQHIPYLSGFQSVMGSPSNYVVTTVLQRIYVDQLSLSGQYPFSQTRRVELGLSGTRLGFDQQVEDVEVSGNVIVRRSLRDEPAPGPVTYAQGSAAFVGDNSFSAYTSPIVGTRYRFEVAPTVGTVVFNTGLADMRRYFFKRPFTLAFRGLQYGRYGRDADNYDRLSPIYLGEETLIRGYGYGSFTPDECEAGTDPASNQRCPVFDRLLGSRIGVINAEFRIPLFGTSGFGLINFPYLPLEVSPFFDAGIAWTSNQSPEFRVATVANNTPADCANDATLQGFLKPCAERIPVMSAGVSFRFNVLGYMILETYVAHPFQRPTKDWVVGIQLAPGW